MQINLKQYCRNGLIKAGMALSFVFVMSFSHSSNASIDDISLVDSCTELVTIVKIRGQKPKLTIVSNSPSEIFRAGYCLGALEQHQRTERDSCQPDWLKRAKYIAGFISISNKLPSERTLLSKSCHAQ